MKKFMLSAFVVAVSAAYVLYESVSAASGPVVSGPPVTPTTTPVIAEPSPTPIPQPEPAPTPQPTPVPEPQPVPEPPPTPPKPKGQYADGTYTGSVENAFYGLVQVAAIISGGKLTDVQFLQYPSDRSTSRYINSQAMDYLKEEALQAQSANVNIVSGATDTTIAFRESLATALAEAKN